MKRTVGVLAIQGCIQPHVEMYRRLGVTCRPVVPGRDLAEVDRLVLPGGESTTMLKLLQRSGTFELLKTYCREHPVWGICAGSILLAQEVVNPEQPSLGAIPVRAHRNFYGSQRESFCTSLEVPALGRAIPVDFIRAPHLEPMHPEVETLAMYEERHVIMKYDRALVSACHSELGTDPGLHEYFLSL